MFGRHPPAKRRGLLQDAPLDDSERCRSCAADCCRGFPSVELSAAEYTYLQQIGATRLEFTLSGHYYLLIENGCEFLTNNLCAIYAQRPSICRRFFCTDI
jgi:Fe-S-cluster containining protein